MQKDRLKTIIDLIDTNSIVADIGTDHGLIPIYLSVNNISKKVIASDISSKSLQKLIEKLDNNPDIHNIETRVSNGLDKYKPFEVDTIIISGMGGFLISEIISNNLSIAKSANNLILQANNSVSELRRFLENNSFKIIEEKDLYENNKYYQIIKTEVGVDSYKENYEYEYGKLLIRNKSNNLKRYINSQIETYEKIKENLLYFDNSSLDNRVEELQDEIRKLNIVRELLEN